MHAMVLCLRVHRAHALVLKGRALRCERGWSRLGACHGGNHWCLRDSRRDLSAIVGVIAGRGRVRASVRVVVAVGNMWLRSMLGLEGAVLLRRRLILLRGDGSGLANKKVSMEYASAPKIETTRQRLSCYIPLPALCWESSLMWGRFQKPWRQRKVRQPWPR